MKGRFKPVYLLILTQWSKKTKWKALKKALRTKTGHKAVINTASTWLRGQSRARPYGLLHLYSSHKSL